MHPDPATDIPTSPRGGLHALFGAAVGRAVLLGLLGTAWLVVSGYLIWQFGLAPRADYSAGRLAIAGALGAGQLLLGVLAGLLINVTAPLLASVEWLERTCRALVNPLMAGVVAKLPGGQMGATVEEFRTLVDQQIATRSPGLPAPWRIFSLTRALPSLLAGWTLRLARFMLLGEFLASLQSRGETRVSAVAVEAFARERLVGLLLSQHRELLEILYWVGWLVAALFVAAPAIAVWWLR